MREDAGSGWLVFLGGCLTRTCSTSIVWQCVRIEVVCSKSSNISLSRLRRGLGFSMPPTGPFVRISLQQQLRSYKVGSYNAVQSRVMIGSNGICSFLGWDAGAAMLLCSRRAIRKECQWNIITPSPFIGFSWIKVLVIYSVYFTLSVKVFQRAKVIWTGQC